MFHPSRSDSRQQAGFATDSPATVIQEAHPTFDGSHAPSMTPGARRAVVSAPVSPRKQRRVGGQQAYGNQAMLRMLTHSQPVIQRKVVINEPGDMYEKEADRVADQVMRTPDADPSIAFAPAGLTCKCAACEEEEEDENKLQMKPSRTRGAAGREAPPSVHDVLRSPGQPLETMSRGFFESRFGHDFGQVRIHANDDSAAASADAVGARAYTVGSHVVFARGEYSPSTDGGKRLIAHELTHVVQQGESGPRLARELGSEEEDPLAGSYTDDAPTTITPAKLPAAGEAPVARPKVTLPALTPDEKMERLVLGERAFEASPAGPPINTPKGAGSALGPGYRTYAAVQVIDGEGNQVAVAIGRYLGGGKAHAEADAVRNLVAALEQLKSKPGVMRMIVVVDQTVCKNCIGALDKFAVDAGIEQMDVYLPAREGVTPKTAARTAAKVGAKTDLSFTKKFPPKPSSSGTQNEQPAEPAERTPAQDTEGKSAATTDKPAAAADQAADPAAVSEQSEPATPSESSAPVETEISVVSTVETPDGQTFTELEINFGRGLELANNAAPDVGALPSAMRILITQNAEGALITAQSATGESAALAEAIARQILDANPGRAAAGAIEGAAGTAAGTAAGASHALAVVSKGLKWGGTALFVVLTGYQLIRAKPGERPRVLSKAAGGMAGGVVGTYLYCNLVLDMETAGWGLLLCGFVAGGVGGYVGGEKAGEAYDEATMSQMDFALRELSEQPVNVRRLFYSLVAEAGAAGFPMTPEFVKRFVGAVPADLKDSELITLAGKLHAAPLANVAKNVDAGIASIEHAVAGLPGRGSFSSQPPDLFKPNIDIGLPRGISFGPEGAGKLTILPGFGNTPIAVPPDAVPSNIHPLLQIDLENPKKRK